MDSNTHSTQPPEPPELSGPPGPPTWPEPPRWPEPPGLAEELAELPEDLAELATVVNKLATTDLHNQPDTARAERLVAWQRLLDRQAGLWLKELAEFDARGAAGADHDQPAPSTASWLRGRLRLGVGTTRSAVRTARALFRGPLPETAAALTAGVISPAHAKVIAEGTADLPPHVAADADPVLADLAGRLDPPGLRRAVDHLGQVADPDGADAARERHHARRGLWLSPTWDGLVAVDGLLEPEAGHLVQAALEPLARPADAHDDRKGGQRNADALAELCRRALEGGRLPKTGGVRPQLLVTVGLESLLGHPGSLGGEAGWTGPLTPEACRRLACDATVTRVLVTRQPSSDGRAARCSCEQAAVAAGQLDQPGLTPRLRASMALLPPPLGGAPSQPLDLGRATRVVTPAQRSALAVRDSGCVFPGCDRPLAWCEGHHLVSWLDGGPTDLANLALLCRAHHRDVHEGGWQLTRGPDGRFTATPPQRRHRAA
jgi:Domain of unknown function (DUF222)/HNH endonuclease